MKKEKSNSLENRLKMTRRQVLKAGIYAGAGMMLPLRFLPAKAFANNWGQACEILGCSNFGLSDPSLQPKFVELAPNALDPGFLYKDFGGTPSPRPNFKIKASKTKQETGLIDPATGKKLKTNLWGYGQNTVSWPGQTVQVMSSLGNPEAAKETVIQWDNKIRDKSHLLPLDTNLHWCYSLHGDSSANGVDYRQFSLEKDGVPIITHLHGGNSDFQFDGNPEFFYSPNNKVIGPQWDSVPGGFTNVFRYNNAVQAGNLWYHDHALGITRLNVYAGLAGFYFVRDLDDTGMPDNPLGLPAFPYELAYAIQDRMFTDKGALFYPAFPGDPAWADFITDEGLADYEVPQPSVLAEFFGDYMVVNGKIWPKENVEPRHYRMRLLNGCDSRFLVIRFRSVTMGATSLLEAGTPIKFYVIGSDQGLASEAHFVDQLVVEPGSRYDIVFNFDGLSGERVIMENIGGDVPFGGDIPGEQIFKFTNMVMAFDVNLAFGELSDVTDDFDPAKIDQYSGNKKDVDKVRRVALFEGRDEFGRLQPLLGTVADDLSTATAYAWFQETTEKTTVHTTEEWEIYNFTGDAHPVHLHLVKFQILGRHEISFDEDEANPQMVLQHNGQYGTVAAISNITVGNGVNLGPSDGYVENSPKDVVTALPGQRTRIKATFDKEGRYVWHCHILSHEDHEMMRVLQVLPKVT